MSRRDDALMHVKESLHKKNCALVHKDDIFTDDEQRMWDAAQEFVGRFANSEQAIAFDKTFTDHLKSNIEFDQAARAELDQLKRQAEERLSAVEASKAELKDARKARLLRFLSAGLAGKKIDVAAAKHAFVSAMSQEQAARTEINLTAKRLKIDRKSKNTVFKPYVFITKHWRGTGLSYTDPSVMLGTADSLLDIAEDYYGEPAKVRIPTLWRVSAVPEGIELPPRTGSQNWHRDQGDARMLKVFAYFSDVDEGSGALEYIPSSLPKNSKWAKSIPLTENSGYPPQDLIERVVPKDEIFRCIGPVGTLAFVDTAGLHRGGYAVSGPRITAQATYLRERTMIPQTPLIRQGLRPEGLTERQYQALC